MARAITTLACLPIGTTAERGLQRSRVALPGGPRRVDVGRRRPAVCGAPGLSPTKAPQPLSYLALPVCCVYRSGRMG